MAATTTPPEKSGLTMLLAEFVVKLGTPGHEVPKVCLSCLDAFRKSAKLNKLPIQHQSTFSIALIPSV
jgi:hypothetical protein